MKIKTLSEYSLSMSVNENANYSGNIPANVARCFDKLYFSAFDNTENVQISANDRNSTLLVRNCKELYMTVNAACRLADTDWFIYFEEPVDLTLGSGTRGSDKMWFGNEDVSKVLTWLASNKGNTFNKFTVYRFDLDGYDGFTDGFLDMIYTNELCFKQCSHLLSMQLPDKTAFKNKGLKFNSDAPRANTFFAENGLLTGTADEVKRHMRKSFLKDFEHKQAIESEERELIEQSRLHPHNIYTYNSDETHYCDLRGTTLDWRFSSVDDYKRNWPKDLDIVDGMYINVDDETFKITSHDVMAGPFVDGGVLVELSLERA